MIDTDIDFSSAIAEGYDFYLRPLLFEPYAEDLARRAAALGPREILETAAGTGAVTDALLVACPDATITASDLNTGMLAIAKARIGSQRVTFREADAQSLPFPDACFDLVVCQFGVMFFPDRVAAYHEARRVLRQGGRFLFNVWNRLEANAASAVIARSLAETLALEGPTFIERVPFGYHDKGRVESDLRAAGFEEIRAETVGKRSRAANPRDAAAGMCLGSPLRAEIEAKAPDLMQRLIEKVTAALGPYISSDGLDAPMSAHVFSAS
jgi:ubiquinone/menaquinone biosynthesis C-methylase UbiE